MDAPSPLPIVAKLPRTRPKFWIVSAMEDMRGSILHMMMPSMMPAIRRMNANIFEVYHGVFWVVGVWMVKLNVGVFGCPSEYGGAGQEEKGGR